MSRRVSRENTMERGVDGGNDYMDRGHLRRARMSISVRLADLTCESEEDVFYRPA